MSRAPRIVIVGGGFAGLAAAKALRKARAAITLLDRRNHHLFQPLLYQVAIAGLAPRDIAVPIRAALRTQSNLTVLLSEATQIDLAQRLIRTPNGALPYDYAIIGAGAVSHYLGNDAWARHAPSLKTVEDALEMRRRVLWAYEMAELAADDPSRAEYQSFVVIGGGPTGVELAGAVAELAHHALTRDFRRCDPTRARVSLLHAGSQLLPGMPCELGAKAKASLEKMGVDVRLDARVDGVDVTGVTFGGERITARTVLWAAGVKPSPLLETPGVPLQNGRVPVDVDLSVPGHAEVFVVGDGMHFEQDGAELPGMAQVAIQSGAHAAKNVARLRRRREIRSTIATRAAWQRSVGRLRLRTSRTGSSPGASRGSCGWRSTCFSW